MKVDVISNEFGTMYRATYITPGVRTIVFGNSLMSAISNALKSINRLTHYDPSFNQD